MSSSDSKPVGEIVLVGRSGYQIYSEIWKDKIRFRARVGKPYVKKETRQPGLVAVMEEDSTADFLQAATEAAEKLEQIRNAAFQRAVEQNKETVSKVELEIVQDDEAEAPKAA